MAQEKYHVSPVLLMVQKAYHVSLLLVMAQQKYHVSPSVTMAQQNFNPESDPSDHSSLCSPWEINTPVSHDHARFISDPEDTDN